MDILYFTIITTLYAPKRQYLGKLITRTANKPDNSANLLPPV